MLDTTRIDHTTPTLFAELGGAVADAITAECATHPVLRRCEIERRCFDADAIAHMRIRAARKQARLHVAA